MSLCFGCRAAPPQPLTRTKAFLTVSNQALKLELDFLDQACFTEFSTLTLLIINAFLSSRFFSSDFPVADIANAILSANRSDFGNTGGTHSVKSLSSTIKHCKHSLPFFKLFKSN